MNWKRILGIAAVVVAILFLLGYQSHTIDKLREDRDKYRSNTTTLMEDVSRYKVRDSLSGARVEALELSVKELQKWRAEDADLIEDLKIKNRDLASVNKAQTQTIIELRSAPKDTVVLIDSIPVGAKKIHSGDRWYDFDGILTDDVFTGSISIRDSLVMVDQVKYKRFLFWNTKKIKERSLDCVSKNPHTQVMGVEYILIDR